MPRHRYKEIFLELGVALTPEEEANLHKLAHAIEAGGFDSASLMQDADGQKHGEAKLLAVTLDGIEAESLEDLGAVESIGGCVRSFQLFETELDEAPQLIPSQFIPVALDVDETTLLHFCVAGADRGALFLQWTEGQSGPFVESVGDLVLVTRSLGSTLA